MSSRARAAAAAAALAQQQQTASPASTGARSNEYFVPRDGIDREVITADICRYLGNDALVRPGTYTNPQTGEATQGYFITAYRNLTTAMIEDLRADSAKWDLERRSLGTQPSYNNVPYPYRNSSTHQQRQEDGPSQDPDFDRYPDTSAYGQQDYHQSSASAGYGQAFTSQGSGYASQYASEPADARFTTISSVGVPAAGYGQSQQDSPYYPGAHRPVVDDQSYSSQQQQSRQQQAAAAAAASSAGYGAYQSAAGSSQYEPPIDSLYGRGGQASSSAYPATARSGAYADQYKRTTPPPRSGQPMGGAASSRRPYGR